MQGHQILSLRRGLRWETQQITPILSPKSPQVHIQPQACFWLAIAGLLRSNTGPGGRGPRVRAPDPPPTPSTQATALTHPHWRVPAARGPWLPAGAQNPRHSLCPQSHSCWAERQPPESSAASGAPLSVTRRSQSRNHFPRVSAEASVWCSALPGACPLAPGGRGTVLQHPEGRSASAGTGSARRPLPLRHQAQLACHCGCRREEPGRIR